MKLNLINILFKIIIICILKNHQHEMEHETNIDQVSIELNYEEHDQIENSFQFELVEIVLQLEFGHKQRFGWPQVE